MPNIEILRKFDQSVMLNAIQTSNRMKLEREAGPKPLAVRMGDVAVELPA